MAFIRIRTIKGRQYRYLEERWREGKKVKSKSTFLGAVGAVAGFIGANLRGEPGERALANMIAEGERNRDEILARQALAALSAEKERPAIAGLGNAPVDQTFPVSPPSSETAPHSPGSDETAPEASPR